MKHTISIILLIVLGFFSCKKEENKEVLFAQHDIVDTVRNVTIHVMPQDLLESQSDSVQAYYRKFKNYEIWYDRENREDLIAQIENCKYEGLNPEDYNLNKIYNIEIKRDSLEKEELLAYDVLLTETFEKLATHFYKGKVNPKEVAPNWDLFEKKTAVANWLEEAIPANKVATTLKGLLPKHWQYQQLKRALVEIDQFPASTFDSIRFVKKITLNDTFPALKKIKERLFFWKDYKRKDTLYTAVYDTITFKAMKRFQTRHGLLADGVVGASTIKALNYNKETRKQQILSNLERWRWYPKDLGKQYIIVNLPEFMLHYVVDQDTVAERKVVVGRPKRMTPVLSSKLSNFVFNPTWTVPPTIIKEDLAVEAAKNRGYFSRSRITIYNSKNQEVSPVNWNPNKPNNYRYVQTPGYNNSLGLVKFNFPNSHLVYLHDTNHREMFAYNYRALSSGCVRVENPVVLAKQILSSQEGDRWKSGEEVDKIIAKKDTYMVKVKQSIYIHQLYWTCWMNKNGLQFREDIYNLDLRVYSKLRS